MTIWPSTATSQCAFGAACPPLVVLLAHTYAHCGSPSVVVKVQGWPGAMVTDSRLR